MALRVPIERESGPVLSNAYNYEARHTREVGTSMKDIPTEGEPVGFEEHVKPLFRPRDRESMQSHFDLWSYDDVSVQAGAIVARLRDGTMPCDGAWPAEQVDLLERWVDAGKPR
jgi:hypothetical protein